MRIMEITSLPLHDGKAPRWLLSRMQRLSDILVSYILDNFGSSWLIERLTDSLWLQALSCALGYDWHSSGTTTVTLAVIKRSLSNNEELRVAGGKGKAAMNINNDIEEISKSFDLDSSKLLNINRLVFKINSTMVYDNIGMYHSSMLISREGRFGIIQQGMMSSYAIRFQILDSSLDNKDITNETNRSIYADSSYESIDLTFNKNLNIKKEILELINNDIDTINTFRFHIFPKRHQLIKEIDLSADARRVLMELSDRGIERIEELIDAKGIGRKTVRSLALLASLLYDDEIYKRDPFLYAYTVGGKDGTPYRISLKHYDELIATFNDIIDAMSRNEVNLNKYNIINRISNLVNNEYKRRLIAWERYQENGRRKEE
ncbi:MAG: uncharacterized DUF763 protein AF1496 [Candidatus Micrarchaeota archaeon]|nr:MAG: uncharacterized DUF763 protein AF1496 [Candidatus Micrarchaeota archaeon]